MGGMLMLLACGFTRAQDGGGAGAVDGTFDEQGPDTELDDLLVFEDLPVVISATRRARPMNYSPVPVSVISRDDIHFSGLTSIPDLLQFVPGVDMVRIDRNRRAIGIRGLHEVTSDRTIALVDGRNASSPFFGGPEFLRLPLFLEDIERIEVVRGPGGAAWGANAFNGAINIITRDPADAPGFLLRSTINEYGDSFTHMRLAGGDDKAAWRVTTGYTDYESSSDAISSSTFTSTDFAREKMIDGKFAYSISNATEVSAGLGYSDRDEGDFSLFGAPPKASGYRRTMRSFVRVDHEVDERTSGYVQLFANFGDSVRQSLAIYNSTEVDLEAQFDFELGDHFLSFGGNLRYQHLDTDPELSSQLALVGGARSEQWAGLFVSDQFRVSDWVTVEGQLRGDYYSEVTTDWSGRASALFALDEGHRHVSRLSVARAFRSPLAGIRATTALFLTPTNVPFLQFTPNPGLNNERLVSFEAGHTFRATEQVTLRTDVYRYEYDDLIGFVSQPGLPAITNSQNLAGASAFGGELECRFTGEDWSASGWYSYEDFQADRGNQSLRAYEPARHKGGISTRWRLPEGFGFNLNYKYFDGSPGQPIGINTLRIDAAHRLDVTLSKQWSGGEIMVGVTDVLDDTDLSLAGHETIGSTFFMRMELNF